MSSVTGLAGHLMAEITGRLEDLAAASVDLHATTGDAQSLARDLDDVTQLLKAYQVLERTGSALE